MSHEVPDRASWQRGEGAVIFRELADEVFGENTFTLPDKTIAEALAEASHETRNPAYHKANEVLHRLNVVTKQRYHQTKFAHDIETNGEQAGRIAAMTFADKAEQLHDEIIASVTTLPLNIIEIAQRRSQLLQPGMPVYANLGCIAHIMTSPWFDQVIDNAAFRTNAQWELLSIGSIYDDETADTPRLKKYGFDYGLLDGDVVFDFDQPTKARFHAGIRDRNNNFRSPEPVITAGEVQGTTAGCPARFHHAIVDPGTAADLAEQYGRPAEVLTGHRDRNGIQIALASIGNILTRAALIDETLTRS